MDITREVGKGSRPQAHPENPGIARGLATARSGATMGWSVWLIPSLADLAFASLLAFVLAFRSRQLLNADSDILRHLVVGQKILADHAVPFVDFFSYTRHGEPFVAHQWLSEALFALVYQQLGLVGVAVFAAVLVALPFLLLTRWMIRDGANPFLVLILLPIGALASSPFWIARPYLISVLLALLWTRALTRYRDTMALRYLVPLPPLMTLWVNLHGGFVWGFAILAIFLLAAALSPFWCRGSAPNGAASRLGSVRVASNARSRVLALATTAVASLIATGAHPVGYAVLPYILSYSQFPLMLDRTVETMSPDFHQPGPQLFLMLLMVALAIGGRMRRRVDLSDLGMLLGWASLALLYMRNIPIFVVTCLPILGGLATESFWPHSDKAIHSPTGDAPNEGVGSTDGTGRRTTVAERLTTADRQLGRPLLPIAAVLLALLLSTGVLGGGRIDASLDPAVYPVEALRHTEEAGVHGNLFNYFTWGNYVTFATYPKYPVFIDAQADFYGERVTRDYLTVADLKPGWESILDRYQVGWVLFPHRSPVSMALARTPGWRLSYEDQTADILVRAAGVR